MTKKLFVIVATALTCLWAGAMTTEAADFKTLDGTWKGLLTVAVGVSGPVTVTLTTRGEKRITGTIEIALTGFDQNGQPVTFTFNGDLDGYTIAQTVFFIRSVLRPPSPPFPCPNNFTPVNAVFQGIASIDDMNPIVLVITQSGIGNCGDGVFLTMTLNKQQ